MSGDLSTVDVVTAEEGQTQSLVLTLLSPHHSLLRTRQRRVRRPSPSSGETDTGSDAMRNDKQGRVINGTDSSGVQIIEGERHQVELEAPVRSFTCSVGDCRRRYRNIDKLRMSFPPLRSYYITLSCRAVVLHYQHSGAHGTIGLALLASGQHKWLQHSDSTARQSIAVHSVTTPPTSPSSTKSAGSQSQQQWFGQSQHLSRDVVNALLPPTEENISAAPPVPPDIQLVI